MEFKKKTALEEEEVLRWGGGSFMVASMVGVLQGWGAQGLSA
jgi:hypothetical protein